MELKIYDKKSFAIDNSAKIVCEYLNKILADREDCICFYKNPLYYTEGNLIPSWVVVDREYGVVVFKTYNHSIEDLSFINENYWILNEDKIGNEINYFEDYCYRFSSEIYRPKNKLKGIVSFSSYIVFPFFDNINSIISSGYNLNNILDSSYESKNIFDNIEKHSITDTEWDTLYSVVQNADALVKSTGIKLDEPIKNLREAVIFNEQRICVLDNTQLDAALQIPENSERIRGLAGTGKTIILAMKAARIHFIYPEAKVVYTFYTQSLYTQAKNLISRFYRKMKGDEPDWNNLKVLHAWGGASKEGVYSYICQRNGLAPIPFSAVRYQASPFGSVCSTALDKTITREFDYVLIDEAQDMPLQFFQLIELATKKPQKIVVAYDELQSTGDVKMKEFDELFGKDISGIPKITLDAEKDFILRRSYRNHHKILHTAVALGFGIYNQNGVVQIIDSEETWAAIGYEIKQGTIGFNNKLIIERPATNSPNKIDNFFKKYEIINVNGYDTRDAEIAKVAEDIATLVNDEKVKPHDIIVIDLDLRNSKKNLTNLQMHLYDSDINSKIPGVVDNAGDFFIEDNVTLTTVRRAKGNEAPVIFVMGIDTIYDYTSMLEERLFRNMAFISITRAKGWCFISGSGKNMTQFNVEYNKIITKFPLLDFTYPTEARYNLISKINYITKNSEAEAEYQDNIDIVNKLLNADIDFLELLPNDLKKKLKLKLKKI